MKTSSFLMVRPTRVAALIGASLLAMASRAGATILSAPTVTGSAPAFSPAFVPENTLDNTEFEYASAG